MRISFMIALAVGLAAVPDGTLHAKDKAPVKTTNAKSMAGWSQVVVSSFSIAFVTEKTDAAFAGRRNGGKAMGVIAKAKLDGLAPADFQAIVDAAYTDFASRMAAAGYTIGNRAAMVADKQMAKVQYVTSGTAGTLTVGKDAKVKAVFYGPTAFGATPLLKGETGDSGVAAMGGMFGALKSFSALGGPTMAKMMYATQNGQPTVSVMYVVDFADVDHYSGSYLKQASLDLNASLAVVETLSMVSTINAKGAAGSVALAQPIATPGKFGKLADSTTTGQRLDNAAGALIGGLFGSGSNVYKHLTFTADAPAYRIGAIEAADAANAVVVAELAAHR